MILIDYVYWTLFFMILGLVGIAIESRSIVYLLCFIEIFYLGLNMFIILYACIWQDIIGLILSFFVLSLTAVETSVGLTLIFLVAKNTHTARLSGLRLTS